MLQINTLNIKETVQRKNTITSRTSRMFLPVQHCSPFIGRNSSGEVNWIQLL